MKILCKISDEELAAYLDGMLADKESAKVNAAMDIGMLEILNVSRKANDEFPPDNDISLPSWGKISTSSVLPLYEPLAMAGFLGESNAEEAVDDDTKDEDK